MADIKRIKSAIDEFLKEKYEKTTTPVEVTPYLANKGLLKDSTSSPGKPLREILRKGKIQNAYKKEGKWIIFHSEDKSVVFNSKSGKGIKNEKVISTDTHKLYPIGELIVELIVDKFGIKPTCLYEYKPDWLLSNPTIQLIDNWPELSCLYNELTDDLFSLKEIIKELPYRKQKQKQAFDIWIGEPFNFAIEFDEKQHFNQYRRMTLNYYDSVDIKFPKQYYQELNATIEIKPGKSGFTRLKGNDPLFPEMYEGEKQDNRVRQRAFRDYLKDLLPIKNGFNPTLRIPYHVTNKSVRNFSKAELESVKNYLREYGLI